MSVYVANRGEIAVRLVRAALEAGHEVVVAVTRARWTRSPPAWPRESTSCPVRARPPTSMRRCSSRVPPSTGCTMLHPGYGFLSESPVLARECAAAGVVFVGPDAALLELFGDKGQAREAAVGAGVPVLPATPVGITEAEAAQFAAAQDPAGVMIKAAAGGGGRGMRAVPAGALLTEAWQRAGSEAERSFGSAGLFAELYVERARHVEVQVAADGEGGVVHLGERYCTLQRRFQKVVEVAPAPGLPQEVRAALHDAAVRLLAGRGYRGLATVEFLVDADDPGRWWFIEVNPRLQVEHPVTELVTGVDLVLTQLRLAAGESLDDIGLGTPPPVSGAAVELRVAAERIGASGEALPAHGVVGRLTLPTGPGVRVDTHLVEGTRVDGAFDSLVAKLVTHSHGGLTGALHKARRAAVECEIAGVETNLTLLRELLEHDDVARWAVTTQWFGRSGLSRASADGGVVDGEVVAEMAGTVVAVLVEEGQAVAAGDPLVVLEAMKMEHLVVAPRRRGGRRRRLRPGAAYVPDEPLAVLRQATESVASSGGDGSRPRRRASGRTSRRLAAPAACRRTTPPPAAVAKRHARAADRAGERGGPRATTARSRSTARWRVAAQRAAARAGRAGRADAGRRDRRPASAPSTPRCTVPTARAPRCSPTTTRSSPARRASATTRRPTGCWSWPSAAGCRSCCSPRAAAAGRGHRLLRSRPPRRADLPAVRAAVRARAAGRDRRPAAASPATPRCSAAATSSSRRRTRPSGWAARR